jgi:hypothetical protein
MRTAPNVGATSCNRQEEEWCHRCLTHSAPWPSALPARPLRPFCSAAPPRPRSRPARACRESSAPTSSWCAPTAHRGSSSVRPYTGTPRRDADSVPSRNQSASLTSRPQRCRLTACLDRAHRQDLTRGTPVDLDRRRKRTRTVPTGAVRCPTSRPGSTRSVATAPGSREATDAPTWTCPRRYRLQHLP